MTIKTFAPVKGATIAATGGTAVPFSLLGQNLDELQVSFDQTSVINRCSARFSKRAAVVSAAAPSGYTQSRNEVLLRFPTTLADGSVVISTAKIQLAVDVNASAATRQAMRDITAQVLYHADMDAFWNNQTID